MSGQLTRPIGLDRALSILRASEPRLRKQGVRHAFVFGSVARAEERPGSDVDVLVELDDSMRLSLWDYAGIKLDIAALLDGAADVVNARTLAPEFRDRVRREAIRAF
jgi:hypothetical protein